MGLEEAQVLRQRQVLLDPAGRCPLCHDALGAQRELLGVCGRCGAAYHRACHAELGGCASYACLAPERRGRPAHTTLIGARTEPIQPVPGDAPPLPRWAEAFRIRPEAPRRPRIPAPGRRRDAAVGVALGLAVALVMALSGVSAHERFFALWCQGLVGIVCGNLAPSCGPVALTADERRDLAWSGPAEAYSDPIVRAGLCLARTLMAAAAAQLVALVLSAFL